MTQGGYGNYQIQAQPTMAAAVKTVVKQIRVTQRPAGPVRLVRLAHLGRVGFPGHGRSGNDGQLHRHVALYIEDVWYNRHSTLWNKSRGGYSRPPDSLVPYGELSVDFLKWDQAVYYAGKQNQYVFAVPVK